LTAQVAECGPDPFNEQIWGLNVPLPAGLTDQATVPLGAEPVPDALETLTVHVVDTDPDPDGMVPEVGEHDTCTVTGLSLLPAGAVGVGVTVGEGVGVAVPPGVGVGLGVEPGSGAKAGGCGARSGPSDVR
jgi:hypothetical protein